jgi:LPXTG-site transpeptidase (sortase) family protein
MRYHSALKTSLVIFSIIGLISQAFFLKTPQVRGQGAGNCQSGYTAKIESAPFTYTAEGIISRLFVKAGSQNQEDGACTEFTGNGDNGCYRVEGLGTNTVTVTNIAGGPDCKDISHVEFFLVDPTPAQPTATPIVPTSTPVIPTNTPTVAIPTQVPTETLIPTIPTLSATATPTAIITDPVATFTPTPTQVSEPTATPTSGSSSSNNDNGSSSSNTSNNSSSNNNGSTSGNQIVAALVRANRPKVLGATINYNPLVDAIRLAFNGEVLGVTTLARTGNSPLAYTKLPSSNQILDNWFINIPKIGVNQAIYQPQTLGSELTVGHNEVLKTEINGAAVYYGHNSRYVFAPLDKLQSGDSILIDNGVVKTYRVLSSETVEASDTDFFKNEANTIYLMTCTDTQAKSRLVVKAVLQ